MKVLGIHASFNSKTHDPNIALLEDNKIIFAAEEERFLRYKSSSEGSQSTVYEMPRIYGYKYNGYRFNRLRWHNI